MKYLNQWSKILLSSIIFIWFLILWINNVTDSYYFWLKSADNTPENISQIEEALNINLPIVSFIFDPREDSDVLNSIDKIVEQLWTDRIYHFTLSPDEYSAEDVVMWKFDDEYRAFFQKVKEHNLHIIFRTMHEMNWWRYPRSSNPEKFKAARIHIRCLARSLWLTEDNIAFDFSVNHRDMPTNWVPSQSAKLIECNQNRSDCQHFEDYYPGDEFVDVVWFSFYNRWKANSNRLWLSPEQILYDRNRKTYERLQKFWKPIIIDEVATTSVRYDWNFNFEKSQKEYLENSDRKDYRLGQLQQFLMYHPEIIATIYFNTDYTHWLQFLVTWEADWSIINLENNKIYNGFRELDLFWEKELNHILKDLFNQELISIDGYEIYVSPSFSKEIQTISQLINKKSTTIQDKLNYVHQLQKVNFKSDSIAKALKTLGNLYNKEIITWNNL